MSYWADGLSCGCAICGWTIEWMDCYAERFKLMDFLDFIDFLDFLDFLEVLDKLDTLDALDALD